ncbi:MAG: pyridoxal phosphate-dependent aminotransferase [Bacteroidales bacterium]|nr:pyridoxal phosphate-dependent aminotransferase [Clostridium sp.]MCM1203714.1 pyridoxal phosphate-dependent aminotransferase [Bacteroidales bacterium]
MLNQSFIDMCGQKSVIRELFAYGSERAKEIGYENVFDYSLGNPSTPAPESFTGEMIRLLQEEDPVTLHGYSPTLGIDSVREAVADSLNRRFEMNYEKKDIFMVSGAAGAIAHAVRAVTMPGDEVLTFAPFFPEYNPYISATGAVLRVVPADISSFQINFDAFVDMLNEKVMAVLINTPNNPSGIVYSTETIDRLAMILTEKEEEFGHPIYIISDEPYREIVFQGVDSPFVAAHYNNTITCYSFSKSLSLPGERIGYLAVNPACGDSALLVDMFGQISRGIGHNCPPSIIQLAVSKALYDTSDLSVYETNKNILYTELTKMGFEIVEPGGTFYMFPKALEADARAFSDKAKKLDLLLVPSDTFGVPGHFRISYCIPTEKVERSIPVFQKLADMYL